MWYGKGTVKGDKLWLQYCTSRVRDISTTHELDGEEPDAPRKSSPAARDVDGPPHSRRLNQLPRLRRLLLELFVILTLSPPFMA